ncbi:MAG: alkaline phosphatase family protein [Alphaproteobacteria bacterium]|nr:alkaline phosphatase family protein [Alphaproteobacteria bacterium]
MATTRRLLARKRELGVSAPAFSRRSVLRLLAHLPLWAAALAPVQAQERPLARLAFGSCADQDTPQPIWDAVLAYKPEVFLFAGDNVYGDVTSPDLMELRAAYAKARTLEGFSRLRRQVRHLAIWDDHDYGLNDGGAEFAHKQRAKELFLEFWNVAPDDPRRAREGLYMSTMLGPPGQRIQVILLDTRYFRSPLKPTDRRGAAGRERYLPDADPTKTMLGAAQWQWLAGQLREPAELRLIVSSIQVVVEGHGWERWGNLPLERQRLYDLIAETRAAGVVFLSGDRHLAALYRESTGVPYPLTEITSSGLTRYYATSREAGPNRLGAVYGLPNFGTIDVDWWEGTVGLAVRDEAGHVRRQATLRLDELKPR